MWTMLQKQDLQDNFCFEPVKEATINLLCKLISIGEEKLLKTLQKLLIHPWEPKEPEETISVAIINEISWSEKIKLVSVKEWSELFK